MRYLLAAALVLIPQVAMATCFYDVKAKAIICVPPIPISGPDGGWFDKYLKDILAHPDLAKPELKLSPDLGAQDKEIVRKWTEDRRIELEQFRIRLEKDRAVFSTDDVLKGMNVYENGIDNYKGIMKEIQ